MVGVDGGDVLGCGIVRVKEELHGHSLSSVLHTHQNRNLLSQKVKVQVNSFKSQKEVSIIYGIVGIYKAGQSTIKGMTYRTKW